ncbi:hypothetical protein VCHC57A2_2908, partial [Vibrio cholerae HC-57A2]
MPKRQSTSGTRFLK